MRTLSQEDADTYENENKIYLLFILSPILFIASLFMHANEKASEARGDGRVVGFAIEASKKNREAEDIFGKK